MNISCSVLPNGFAVLKHVAPFSVQARRFSASMSSGDDANWGIRGSGEGTSSVTPRVRKQSLRNITPRSYSSLLKSESESEEEGEVEEEKADKPTVKPNVAAVSQRGKRGSFLLFLCFCDSNVLVCLVTVFLSQIDCDLNLT